jgi:hypothetical protein
MQTEQKPTELQSVDPRVPDPDLIRRIELLLEHARTGELNGLLWVASWHGVLVNSGWTLGAGSNDLKVLGETMCVTQRLTTHCNEST